MKLRSPSGYLALNDAKTILKERMQKISEALKSFKLDSMAARSLREAILCGELDLFVVLTSRPTPLRLHDQRLIEAALCPANSTILTFRYIDRHVQAPFGLSRRDLAELTQDPVCVEEAAFKAWLRKEERKKAWPCHQEDGVSVRRRTVGRPALLPGVIDLIEELGKKGEITSSMLDKEVHARVQKANPAFKDLSFETTRKARKETSYRKS